MRYRSVRHGTIAAPTAAVWPWLIQMGYDRGGWYAIDRLEKLFGVGRFRTGGSARKIEPELQELAVGDTIALSKNYVLNVAVCDPAETLYLVLPDGGKLAWSWRFDLTEHANGTASTLTITTTMAVVSKHCAGRAAMRLLYAGFHVGHGVMERVQLRTLAKRVPRALGDHSS